MAAARIASGERGQMNAPGVLPRYVPSTLAASTAAVDQRPRLLERLALQLAERRRVLAAALKVRHGHGRRLGLELGLERDDAADTAAEWAGEGGMVHGIATLPRCSGVLDDLRHRRLELARS